MVRGALRPFAVLLVFLALACSDNGSDGTSSQAPAVPGTSAARDAAPDPERILEHVRQLSVEIGPRAAGTAGEAEAADYLAGTLRSFGYEVEVEPFNVTSESSRPASLRLTNPGREISALVIGGSASATVGGWVVDAGIGRPGDFPEGTRGAIALMERGELLFGEKVTNAVTAGAAAVIVYNNQPGQFFGTLGNEATVPAIAITREDGEALRRDLAAGDVEAEVMAGPAGSLSSANVVARPPDRDCETVTGGHYDSIVGPGASDNATGAAVVLELAQVIAERGQLAAICFILFGEEEGLHGSRAYVEGLDGAARERMRLMINLDMVGVGDETWLFIGDPEYQRRLEAIAADLGIEGRSGGLPDNASSDHAPFRDAGIPAVMLHRTDDPLLHTPEDVFERVDPENLGAAARLSLALLLSVTNES